ncbi:MAG: PilZ domain-containing protein, partial [Deltaproteobacteria bacterium]|nr:PilZ domain-containing protein [Deltaproteobacteria bacterium]
MNGKEKREFPRIDSKNLVSYVCLDDKGQTLSQGMGRTLNVNETGILLETINPIDKTCVMSLAIGLKDDVINIEGDIVHQRPGEGGWYRSGIKFHE